MSRKAEKNKTYRGRVVTACAVVLFMIALETIYYGYHMKTNRDNTLSAYKDDQLQMVSILAERLEGLSEKEWSQSSMKWLMYPVRNGRSL